MPILRSSFLLITLLLLPLCGLAQNLEDPKSKIDLKLKRYHSLLLKSPRQGVLFEKFHSTWASEYNEEGLADFLKQDAQDDEPNALRLLAYYQIRRRQDNAAQDTLEKALNKQPDNAHIAYEIADSASRLLEYVKALKHIEACLKHSTDEQLTEKANKLKGHLLTKAGKEEEAIDHWRKLAKSFSQDSDLLEDIIDAQLAEGLYEEALTISQKLTKNTKSPYKKVIYKLQSADIFRRAGKPDDAVKLYNEILALSGANSWIEKETLKQIKTLYTLDGNPQKLTQLYEELSIKFPQKIFIKQLYADHLANQKQLETAEKIYRNLIKLTPGDDKPKKAFVKMLLENKQYEKAQVIIQMMLKAKPSNRELLLKLVEIHHSNDDKPLVKKYLKEHYQASKKTEGNMLAYSNKLNQYDLLDDAITQAKITLETFPKSTNVSIALARLYLENKQKDLAIQIWKNAATHSNRDQLLALTNEMQSSGEVDLAYTMLKKQVNTYSADPVFITHLCKFSQYCSADHEAVPWVLSLLLLAEKNIEIENAVQLAARIIRDSDQENKIIAEIEKKQSRQISEDCLLSVLHNSIGNNEQADAILRRISSTEEIPALLQAANIYQQRHQLKLAAKTFEKILSLPKGKRPTYAKKLLSVYNRLANYSAAEKTILLWKALAPNDKQAWQAHIDHHLDRGEFQPALRLLRRCSENFKDDITLLKKLADTHNLTGNFSESKKIYWSLYHGSKKLSDKIGASHDLAKIYHQNGVQNELIEEFEKISRKNPESLSPIMAIAQIHQLSHNSIAEYSVLADALETHPDNLDIIHKLVRINKRNNNLDQALKYLTRAANIDTTPSSKKQLSQLYFEMGDFKKGIKLLTRINQNDPRGLEKIIFSLMSKQQFKTASKLIEENIHHYPTDYRLLYIKILIEHQMEDYDKVHQAVKTIQSIEKDTFKIASASSYPNNYHYSGFFHIHGMSSTPHKKWSTYYNQFTQIINHSYNVKRLLNDLLNMSNSYGGNYGSLANSLPRGLENVKSASLTHLMYIDNELPEKNRGEWVAKTSDIKILNHLRGYYKELLPALNKEKKINFNDWKNVLGETLAYEVIFTKHSSHIDSSIKESALKYFQEKDSEIYHDFLFVFCAKEEQEKAKESQKALEYLKNCKLTNSKINHFLNRIPVRDPALQEQHFALKEQLFEKVKHSDDPKEKALQRQLINELVVRYKKTKTISKVIDLINENYQQQKQQIRFTALPWSSHYSSGSSFQQNPWPSKQLSSINPTVWNFIYEANYQHRYSNNSHSALAFDKDLIFKNIEKIQSPLIRICLLADLGKHDEAYQRLENELKKSPQSRDLLTLIISYHLMHDKDIKKALTYLHELSKYSITRQDKKDVDTGIIQVCKMILQSDKEFAIPNYVKAATRRQINQATNSNQTPDLLKTFRMDVDLEALERKMKRKKLRRQFSRPRHVASINPRDKIKNLLLDGSAEQAIQYALQRLKIASSQHSSDIFYPILSPLKEHDPKLLDQLMRRLKPKEHDMDTLSSWVWLKRVAIESNSQTYKKLALDNLHKMQPATHHERFALAKELMHYFPEKSSQLFKSLPARFDQLITSYIGSNFSTDIASFNNTMVVYGNIVTHLSKRTSVISITNQGYNNPFQGNYSHIDLYSSLGRAFQTSFYYNDGKKNHSLGTYLNPLYPKEIKTVIAPLIKQREENIKKFLQNNSHLPRVADIKFRLAVYQKKLSKNEIIKEAKEILLTHGSSYRTLSSWNYSIQNLRGTENSPNNNYHNTKGAVHALIGTAIENKTFNTIFNKSFMESLKKKNIPLHGQLSELKKMLSASKSQSITYLNEAEKGKAINNRSFISYAILHNKNFREVYVDTMIKSVESYLLEGKARHYMFSSNDHLVFSSKEFAKMKKEKVILAIIQKFLKSHHSQYSGDLQSLHNIRQSGNSLVSAQFSTMYQWLEGLLNTAEYVIPILQMGYDYPVIILHFSSYGQRLSEKALTAYLADSGITKHLRNKNFMIATEAQRNRVKNHYANLRRTANSNSPVTPNVSSPIAIALHKHQISSKFASANEKESEYHATLCSVLSYYRSSANDLKRLASKAHLFKKKEILELHTLLDIYSPNTMQSIMDNGLMDKLRLDSGVIKKTTEMHIDEAMSASGQLSSSIDQRYILYSCTEYNPLKAAEFYYHILREQTQRNSTSTYTYTLKDCSSSTISNSSWAKRDPFSVHRFYSEILSEKHQKKAPHYVCNILSNFRFISNKTLTKEDKEKFSRLLKKIESVKEPDHKAQMQLMLITSLCSSNRVSSVSAKTLLSLLPKEKNKRNSTEQAAFMGLSATLSLQSNRSRSIDTVKPCMLPRKRHKFSTYYAYPVKDEINVIQQWMNKHKKLISTQLLFDFLETQFKYSWNTPMSKSSLELLLYISEKTPQHILSYFAPRIPIEYFNPKNVTQSEDPESIRLRQKVATNFFLSFLKEGITDNNAHYFSEVFSTFHSVIPQDSIEKKNIQQAVQKLTQMNLPSGVQVQVLLLKLGYSTKIPESPKNTSNLYINNRIKFDKKFQAIIDKKLAQNLTNIQKYHLLRIPIYMAWDTNSATATTGGLRQYNIELAKLIEQKILPYSDHRIQADIRKLTDTNDPEIAQMLRPYLNGVFTKQYISKIKARSSSIDYQRSAAIMNWIKNTDSDLLDHLLKHIKTLETRNHRDLLEGIKNSVIHLTNYHLARGEHEKLLALLPQFQKIQAEFWSFNSLKTHKSISSKLKCVSFDKLIYRLHDYLGKKEEYLSNKLYKDLSEERKKYLAKIWNDKETYDFIISDYFCAFKTKKGNHYLQQVFKETSFAKFAGVLRSASWPMKFTHYEKNEYIIELLEAQELSPRDALTYQEIKAYYYEFKKQKEKALAEWNSILESKFLRNPEQQDTLTRYQYEHAIALHYLGESKKAIDILQSMISSNATGYYKRFYKEALKEITKDGEK